jgi:DIS3-like exonuclease 2
MSARISDWPSSSSHPIVQLRHSLGQAGEIESETAAILEMEGIRADDFSEEVLACLPPTPWSISDEELAARRDYRGARVFSIDPPTAKDLDDALSISPLPGGHWRVAVHIADVAHFIAPYR